MGKRGVRNTVAGVLIRFCQSYPEQEHVPKKGGKARGKEKWFCCYCYCYWEKELEEQHDEEDEVVWKICEFCSCVCPNGIDCQQQEMHDGEIVGQSST